jgi:hypothetical protein
VADPRRVSRPRPTYEVTGSLWRGNRSRAHELLDSYRTNVTTPDDAIAVLRDVLGLRFRAVQHIRFTNFQWKNKFRYTIAVCWTDSDPAARDSLYESAAEIVEKSGWYPLPQGERLGSARAMRRHAGASRLDRLPNLATARLTELASAVGPDDGCAIRIYLDTGASILLDTGLPGKLIPESSDRVILVSHLHRDHLGGIESGMARGLPAVLSAGTARLLHASGRMGAIERK